MNKLWLHFLWLGLVTLAPQSLHAAQPAPLDAVQKRYETLKTLQADFVQTASRHNIMGQLENITQEGRFAVKKPGKLRWDYQKPEKRLYVGNGETLWIYSPEENQVITNRWDPQSMALQFLLGSGDLKKDFSPRLLTPEEKKTFKAETGTWLYLTPVGETQKTLGSITALVVRIDEKQHLFSEAWVLDALGSRTHWEFHKIRVNETLSDALFSFKAPKGVQVIDY